MSSESCGWGAIARISSRPASTPPDAEKARTTMAAEVPVLTPEQDRAILQEADFTDVTEFFSAFTFRGWVGYA
ncbi:MAG: tRNA (cmo5U34)-methyltransferase [Mycobacterium sp.]|jgi:tRNA (cmo5U34)-methyltransferase|nr:tRNA (cmo5U34)-methyltransferase [Mycobacterium sp.]